MKTKILIALAVVMMVASCSYDEDVELCHYTIQLIYPESSPIGPYAGARVELRSATASVFVDSTDASGAAHFAIPSGLYSVTSASTVDSMGYRYMINGTLTQIVVSSDSIDHADMPLTVTRRRIFHY